MLYKKIPLIVCISLASCMAFAQSNPNKQTTQTPQIASNKTDTNKSNSQSNTKKTAADKPNVDKIIDAFFTCDNQFFQKITQNPAALTPYVDLAMAEEEKITYIPVDDVEDNEKNTVMFKTPIHYKGLTITGYQNIYIRTTFLGQYFYWGFILDNNVNETKNVLNQFNWNLYNKQNTYVSQSQIYDSTDKPAKWQQNPYTIDNIAPKVGTIEKTLYLEPMSDKQVHLLCSIQGDIDKEMLYQFRPDMQPINKQIAAKWREKQKLNQQTKQQEKLESEQKSNSQPAKDNTSKGEAL
ncbi:hypothetical protein PT273_07315 [Orbaceae bacterium ESL0727]|nr:hypothetical protein [Orbaceae bacterium ESL0727]